MAVTLDLMEYANDGLAQGAYVSSDPEGVEVNFETNGDTNTSIGDVTNVEYWVAAKFTTGNAIVCPSASIYIEGVNGAPTGDLTFRIETDSPGLPSGVLAHANATGTIANGDIQQPAWNKCSFTPFTLAAGTYWLVVYIPAQATNNNWLWTRDNDGGENTAYSINGGSSWTNLPAKSSYYRIYHAFRLQCYSEDTIKEQGSYALKVIAVATGSLNDTLTRTVDPTIDLSGQLVIKFEIRASRTGDNFKIGIHDAGGVTTEHAVIIYAANVWQTEYWDISAIVDANKDAIDSIILTITNADALNTIYWDNMFGTVGRIFVTHQ